MFSESYNSEIQEYFHRQMALLNDRREELRRKETGLPDADGKLPHLCRELLEQKIEEIEDTLKRCTKDEAEALQFLYSAMPLSDMLDYPAAVYLSFARHGVFLWQEGPFAGKVPEKIFANYVLHYRVHNEDISDNRRFFYDRLKGQIAGKNMYDATLEANFWCAGMSTYRTTFMRTQSPLTVYKTGIGRCGEGAPFACTAFRSIGIPARQVATPWWAHCDDNHAWVEAWCDGKWHFLGGGECESRLDKAWFKGPAARAMMINSRWFGKDKPEESVAGRPDMSAKVNQLNLYADTCWLKVKVLDSQGSPVPGAKVDFCLLNYGRFGSMATLVTGGEPEDEDYGAVRLETGYGDLLVCAHGNGSYGEEHVSLTKASLTKEKPEGAQNGVNPEAGDAVHPLAECVVVLNSAMEGLDQWRDVDMRAPREVLQEEQEDEGDPEEGKKRSEAAAEIRRARTEAFYQEEDAERVLMRFSGEDREELDGILHQARGNIKEIVRFLEWDYAGRTMELVRHYGQEAWKLEALKTLKENDYWDIKAEVLAECCMAASPYAGKFPREVFFSGIVCPTVMHEKPRACREALISGLGEEEKDKIRQNPECLPEMIDELVAYMPEQEYANLVTTPMGCLTGGLGNEASKAVLCIQIYRALGIPARVRPMDRAMEYYENGEYKPAAAGKEKENGKTKEGAGAQEAGGPGVTGEAEKTGTLILRPGNSLKLEDWQHYSLSRFEEGRFNPLFIRAGMKKKKAAEKEKDAEKALKERDSHEQSLELELAVGIYRLVTANRLTNGSQLAGIYDFELKEDQVKEVELALREVSPEDLLDKRPVEGLILHTPEGEELGLWDLGGDGRSLLLWLELTKEPTEHILNEMCEKKGLFAALKVPIYFVVRNGADYEADGTLKKTREALPETKVLMDEFGEGYETFARQAGCNPGKLPLVAVLEGGKECIYSGAGYNVGMADMLLRILG